MSSSIASTAAGIDVSTLKHLNANIGAARTLDPAEMAKMQHIREMAFMPQYSHVEGPADTTYAEVKVGGRTVATLMNSGAMITGNADGARLQNLPSVKDSQSVGPTLAKERAEEIARTLGGTVVMAKTAQTQSAWAAQPKPQLVTDWDALRRDPRLATNISGDTLIAAQLLGQRA